MTWPETDRRRLLAQPRLGELSLQRLEAVGVDSIEALRRIGVDEAIERVCRLMHSAAWRNRREALERLANSGADAAMNAFRLPDSTAPPEWPP